MKFFKLFIFSSVISTGWFNFPLFSMEADEFNQSSTKAIGIAHSSKNDENLAQAVSKEEWEQVSTLIHKLSLEKAANHQVAETLKEGYLTAFDDYFSLYKMHFYNRSKSLKKVKRKDDFLKPLFKFVASFEETYDLIKVRHKKNQEDDSYLWKNILPTVQKTFNFFMVGLEKYMGLRLSSLGDLQYSQVHNYQEKHLFYKRDENGFLLFTVQPNISLGDGLYRTYIPYKTPNTDQFIDHVLVFSLSGNKIEVVNNSGLIIKKERGSYSIEPYRGTSEAMPYTSGKSICIFEPKLEKAFEIINNLEKAEETLSTHESFKPFVDKLQKFQQKMIAKEIPESIIDAPFFPDTLVPKGLSDEIFVKRLGKFVNDILGKNTIAFLSFPSNALESMECEFLFLKDLKDNFADQKKDAPNYLLDYLKDTSSSDKIEDIVKTYEEYIFEAYVDEEKKKLEEEVRLQQAERTQMVAEGGHYKNKKPSKKKKPFNPKPAGLKDPGDSKSILSKDKVDSLAREKATKRLADLKLNTKGQIKFRKFMKLVNVATQEIQRLQIPISAALNKSSHGNIKPGTDQPITLVQPHGLYDTIHRKNAKGILQTLVETYFNYLSKEK